jgi:hypothetical protein
METVKIADAALTVADGHAGEADVHSAARHAATKGCEPSNLTALRGI